ncbi:hypothetical protein GDO78_013050 [Eleutherodactylus coqui]|uniref:Uncharacterized protein n=1 Tax=Eleutherodactylus coqui TaxID=57060 RepID=A0A8J6K1U6_ELECQ|nr:hypothetical protein GDO78_013050 [Eleutherodactylus coqui]
MNTITADAGIHFAGHRPLHSTCSLHGLSHCRSSSTPLRSRGCYPLTTSQQFGLYDFNSPHSISLCLLLRLFYRCGTVFLFILCLPIASNLLNRLLHLCLLN